VSLPISASSRAAFAQTKKMFCARLGVSFTSPLRSTAARNMRAAADGLPSASSVNPTPMLEAPRLLKAIVLPGSSCRNARQSCTPRSKYGSAVRSCIL
jgi:hypothetical protein